MLRSLSGKLIAAFLVLLCLISLIYLALTLVTTRLYLREVTQSLNRTLAEHIVESKPSTRPRSRCRARRSTRPRSRRSSTC